MENTLKDEEEINKLEEKVDFSKPHCEGGTPNITAIGAKYIVTCGRNCSPRFYNSCPPYQEYLRQKKQIL